MEFSLEELITFLNLQKKHIILILDYDGTLTEIVNDPMKANLTKERKKILENLNSKETIDILINSGRPIEELMILTDSINIDLLGNHGLFYREKHSKDFIQVIDKNKLLKWDKKMLTIREHLKRNILPKYKQLWIQENAHGFVLHTRLMNDFEKNLFVLEMDVLLKKKFKNITYSTGKEIIEIKPLYIVNKGKGIEWYLKNRFPNDLANNSKIIVVGDDITDEDMFTFINKKKGISIKIGDKSSTNLNNLTAAKIIFKSVDELYLFLEKLNSLAN